MPLSPLSRHKTFSLGLCAAQAMFAQNICAAQNNETDPYPALLLSSLCLLIAALLWGYYHRRLQLREWRELATTREYLHSALWGSGDGLWDWDLRSSKVMRIGIAEMLGFGSDEFDQGSNALFQRIHEDDRPAFLRAVGQHLSGATDYFEVEYRLQHRAGHWVWMLDRGRLLRDETHGHSGGSVKELSFRLAGTTRNITERKRSENELRYLAHFDPLTGLYNRNHFQLQLQQSLQQAQQLRQQCAVLFLDVDHFKDVNDTLGHAQGDALLQQIASRLRHAIEHNAYAARFGGDEFTILLTNIQEPRQIQRQAQRLLDSFRQPFNLQNREISLSPSIGIALFPDNGEDGHTLLRCADMALYRAKAAGRNTYEFYCDDLQESIVRRMSLESSLRQALERNELELYFQPRMSVGSERITGYEALVRWQTNAHGAVPPDEFIAIAEDSGVINAIGDWVLVTACTRAAEWAQQGTPARISVNLSARQLHQGGLAHRLQTILQACNLSVDLLELEITESILLGSCGSGTHDNAAHDVALHNLHLLQRLGVRLALDDFGTGYSSFAYINRYHFDTIKIAREFVTGIGKQKTSGAIAAAIIEMAHKLDMTTVAEGVENQAQFEFLRAAGCDEVQGYYIGLPRAEPAHMPLTEMSEIE